MKSWEFKVPPELDGERIDLAVVHFDTGLSRRKIRSIIDVGGMYLNKKRIRVASRTVSTGDTIRVEYFADALKKIKQTNLELPPECLLFDTDGIIGISKPPGVPSQATRDQSIYHAETLLKKLLQSKNPKERRKLILLHRLDKETTGVLLFATNPEKATFVTEQFKARSVKKKYLAVCYGVPKVSEFTEKCYLSAIDKRTGMVRKVHSGGKPSHTDFRVVAINEKLGLSLLECFPHTGRSHQIRIHLELNGLPIVGDKKYGKKRHLPDSLAALTGEHHFLHAQQISFDSSPGKRRKIKALMFPNMRNFIAQASLAQAK